MIRPFLFTSLSAAMLAAIGVAACGGGGGDGGNTNAVGGGGSATTTSSSSGTITGFGSVFVNGVEFETDEAVFNVDDNPDALESDLDLGMVVTVTGTVNDDGVTGAAEQIEFNHDLEGPISDVPQLDADGLTKTFTVLGTIVIVDTNGTVFDDANPGFTFDTVAQLDVVEVSGYLDETEVLHATRIEQRENATFNPDRTLDGVEIKGLVSNLDATQNTFNVRELAVQVTGATDQSDLPGGLAEGIFVEVNGTLSADGTTLTAVKIEREGFDDDAGEVELEGFVTDFVDTSSFSVNGILINAANAEFEPATLDATLTDGMHVEVEGSIDGGILDAEKVKGREGKIKIDAVVASVSGNTINMGLVEGQPTIGVTVDTETRMEDKLTDLSPFTVADISAGDFLEIKALQAGGGNITATQLKRDDPDDVVLQAPVEASDSAAQTLTMLGVTIATDAATEFQSSDDDDLDSSAAFFNALTAGTLVKVKDELVDDISDGVADEVEFEEED